VTTKLALAAGQTHVEVVRWESDVVAYKAISWVSKAAPTAITAVGHGLKTGWRAAVEAVKGPSDINAKSSPPRSSNYYSVTSTGTDTLTLDGVNTIGMPTYVSGGALRYFVPKSLATATASMDIVDRWTPIARGISRPHLEDEVYAEGDIVHVVPGTHYVCTTAGTSDVSRPADLLVGDGTVTWAAKTDFTGTTVYVSLSNTSGITLNDTEHTITWTVAASDLSGEYWTTAIAQLEVTVSGVVSRVAEYSIAVDHETTR
jgi:hypothetical protein